MNSKTQTKKKSTIYRTGNVTDNRTSSKEGGKEKYETLREYKNTHTYTHTKRKNQHGHQNKKP